MKLDLAKIRSICRRRDVPLTQVLEEAGVSRNAFYNLARKKSLLPASIHAVADQLGVHPSDLLVESVSPADRMKELAEEASEIVASHPGADWDNVRHTLLLLEEKPIDRLRRALRRAHAANVR